MIRVVISALSSAQGFALHACTSRQDCQGNHNWVLEHWYCEVYCFMQILILTVGKPLTSY